MPVTKVGLRSEELWAKGFCNGPYCGPSRCVGRITRLRESMSCEDLALRSNNLECGSQHDVFFYASDRQMDTAPTAFGERRRSDAGITTGGGQSA